MRILITGASGLLGLNLGLRCSAEHTVDGLVHSHMLKEIPFSVHAVDLEEENDVHTVFDRFKPDAVINCAALANVDACEKSPQQAHILNAEMPGWLAEDCDRHAVKLVQISTDAVFNGLKSGKYTEKDTTHQVNSSALILRVNFYGFSISQRRSLAEIFLHTLQTGKTMFGFTDVLFSPLYVVDLADIMLKMMKKDLSGVYHVTSPESLSKYDFGRNIAEKFDLDADLIHPISVEEATFLTAPRSKNLVLDPQKAQDALNMELPGQKEGLEHFYRDHEDGLAQKINNFHRK
jgi:dTDP-4-dehydrorhamnose reductase